MIFLNLKLFYDKELTDQEKVMLAALICVKKDLTTHFPVAKNYNFIVKKDSMIFFTINPTVMRSELGWSKSKFYKTLQSLVRKKKIAKDVELQMYSIL